MESTLYNKYRPKTLKDLVGQNKIKKTIENAVSLRRELSHAMLLVGPAGCGKTTTARILACIANSDPYSVDYDPSIEPYANMLDGSYMDFTEIDAATKTSIDDVREIKSSAIERPLTLKKKIFIIDEASQWRNAASSAILKILEEPPPFVMFILATTEPGKILPTIKSRCEIYQFDKITIKDISSRLKYVCDQENIKNVSQEALDAISRASFGGMRNALTILQSVINRCGSDIDYKSTLEVIGSVDQVSIHNLVESIFNGSLKDVVYYTKLSIKNGGEVNSIFASLLKHIDDMMIAKAYENNNHLFIPDEIKQEWIKRMKETQFNNFVHFIERINYFSSFLKDTPNPEASLDACVLDLACFFMNYSRLKA